MEEKKVSLTKEGYEKLKQDLEYLKTEKRKEVSEKLKLARSYGDLSENSEYDEAKDEQARVESKITELENAIKHAVVIDTDSHDKTEVRFGSTVRVYDREFEEELEYKIVGPKEVDPKNFKISSEAPVGKAMIGKKVGDVVTVTTETGDVIEYEVLEIK